MEAIDEGPTNPSRWFVIQRGGERRDRHDRGRWAGGAGAGVADAASCWALARVKIQDLRNQLQAGGLIDRIGADTVYPTLPTAVEAYRSWAGTNA